MMLFDTFWNTYPHRNGIKTGRADALRRFNNLSREEVIALGIALESYRNHKMDAKYRMLATVFLGRSSKGFRAWIPEEIVEPELFRGAESADTAGHNHICLGCGEKYAGQAHQFWCDVPFCSLPEETVCAEAWQRLNRGGKGLVH